MIRLILLLTAAAGAAFAQGIVSDISVTGIDGPAPASSQIKDVVRFSERSGLVYTNDSIFRTEDAGGTWDQLSLPLLPGRSVASVLFKTPMTGLVLIADPSSVSFELAGTEDGGTTWKRLPIELENAAFLEVIVADASLAGEPGGTLEITARIPTSSNFIGKAVYRSNDGGATWSIVGRSVELNTEVTASAAAKKRNWTVETSGECLGFKSGCIQETKLFISGREVTPPKIKQIQRLSRNAAKEQARAAVPGGSTRVSLNRGFDKCQAGSTTQMQIWWNNSYFFDSNIYFSGRNRACPSQPFTNNPAWIDQVSTMGWGLIPTVVGYQSPCTASATTAKLSYDPAVAEQQGRGEADIASADALSIGLNAGSVIYYDMERYEETGSTPGCRTATVAFLKGWTNRIHELGYISGVYGSPKNAIEDWQLMAPADRMDAVWMARWDNVPSVWRYVSFANFPTDLWIDHQRIKQWQAPHNETWGGVTFNIDGNISDAPVAGVPFRRNTAADFDGDGRTDVSVFRPTTAEWFIYGSAGPTFSAHSFGAASDTLTPGDFDGDGRTDLAVFRSADSTWYMLTKGSFTYRQYGQAGDIPAAADFDGDNRTDIAVFRPSTGTWYIAYSDSVPSFRRVQFGQDGDRPAVGDYDGDGRADIAVWRPSTGMWYVLGTTAGFYGVEWGTAADVPAQGDYDGDGKADPAVFRNSEGTWYVLQSNLGTLIQQFGQDGDRPVTGDYDGDGKYDISVFRPSDNTWYVRQQGGGYTAQTFGGPGDKPVPTAYLPQ
ncbi:MAG: DUF1906 domain-containing protein [Acidobacteria bacterium]|nr:DUF1906 domain-containing protein [Acidobacteriota bacterium]